MAWQAKLNVLYRKHNQDGFFISAFGLRASTGVVELRVGDGLQLGSFITGECYALIGNFVYKLW